MTDKKEYYAELRTQRKKAKELVATWGTIPAGISATGYVFCKLQMEQEGFEGEPGVDMLTFNKRKENGFKVKKGEKSKVKGLTWIKKGGKEGDDDDGFMYPKVYHLFHTSQVEPIGAEAEQETEAENIIQTTKIMMGDREVEITPSTLMKTQEFNFAKVALF